MGLMTNDISVFLSKLLCYNKVLIACHVGPDPDAIGSILALGNFLKSRGKEVFLFAQGGCPDNCSFLAGSDTIVSELSEDAMTSELLVMVDCSELKRTGISEESVANIKNRAVLDHHIQKNEIACTFSMIDSEACSCAILVYDLIKAADTQPDTETSDAILTGIVGDTGAFRFPNTTARVLSVCSDLMERNAKLNYIVKNLFLSRPKNLIGILGNVLSNLQYYYDGMAAVAVITNDMLDGIDKSELEGINAEISSIKGLRLSVLLREEIKGSFRCSFRSDGFIDCSRLAAVFGGGGHKNAAGCTIVSDSYSDAVDCIMKEVANWKASFV